MLHFGITPSVNFEIFGLLGDMGNVVSNNALVIFNDNDKINYSYGLSLGFGFFNHSLYFYFTAKNDYYETVYFTNNLPHKTNYNIKSIIGSLSWFF